MMRMKFIIIAILAVCLTSEKSFAQDLHYSYYHFTPLSVNPANSGAFSGSYRVGGIYTSKDGAISDRSFKNFSLTADAPIIRGLRKQDWIGVGVQADILNVLNGAGNLSPETVQNSDNKFAQNWTFFKVSLAYHLALDKKQSNILTLGAQMNNGSRQYAGFNLSDTRNGIINRQDLDLENFKQLASSSSSGLQNDGTKFRSRDLGVGLLFNARRKKSDLRLGVAVEGILKPRTGLLSNSASGSQGGVSKDSIETKPIGLNIHGDYRIDISPRTSIEPSFYFYNLGPFNALNVNSHVWYQFNPEQEFRGGAGLGVRNVRDVIVYLGARVNSIQVGISYDLNVNDRTLASNGLGGFEIAARYVGVIYKKPKVKPIIFCPRMS